MCLLFMFDQCFYYLQYFYSPFLFRFFCLTEIVSRSPFIKNFLIHRCRKSILCLISSMFYRVRRTPYSLKFYYIFFSYTLLPVDRSLQKVYLRSILLDSMESTVSRNWWSIYLFRWNVESRVRYVDGRLSLMGSLRFVLVLLVRSRVSQHSFLFNKKFLIQRNVRHMGFVCPPFFNKLGTIGHVLFSFQTK